MEREICAGQRYRHFKGGEYEIIALATHSETGETLVIYRALYAQGAVFARPLGMFLGEMDREKYPLVEQRYRFELMEDERT